jgi:hypothetical protein
MARFTDNEVLSGPGVSSHGSPPASPIVSVFACVRVFSTVFRRVVYPLVALYTAPGQYWSNRLIGYIA